MLVQILLLLMGAMFACIGYFWREWQKDRKKLFMLEGHIESILSTLKSLENGVTFAQFRERVNTMYHWWIAQIDRKN